FPARHRFGERGLHGQGAPIIGQGGDVPPARHRRRRLRFEGGGGRERGGDRGVRPGRPQPRRQALLRRIRLDRQAAPGSQEDRAETGFRQRRRDPEGGQKGGLGVERGG